MKLHYTTLIDYSHRITSKPMIDEACKKNHSHEEVIITVAIDIGFNRGFVDFKDLKNAVEGLLGEVRNKNITDVWGLETTEDIATYIGGKIAGDYGYKTEVNIQETPKYGVTYVSR